MMKKIKTDYSKKIFSNAFIYRFFLTLNITVSVFCLILVVLYIVGNYQSFQDKSQQIIITCISYTSIFNMLMSLILLIESVFKIFTEKHKIKHILLVILLLITILFCFICMELSGIISYLSQGLN